MTNYPAARCLTCEEWLSPQGLRMSAEKARKSHEKTELTFRGFQHSIVIVDSAEDWEEINDA